MTTAGFASAAFTQFSTGNAGANSIYLTKVTLIAAATIDAVLMNFPNSTGSISFKILIYDGSHSALLATGSTVTSVASGYNRFALTAPISLSAATYYVGYVCSANCNVSIDITQTNSSWFVSGGQSVASPANPLVGGSTQSNGLMIALEFDGTGASNYGWSADRTSGVTLTSGSTIATLSGSGAQGARSIVTQDVPGATKKYWEVLVGGTISNLSAIGVMGAGASMLSPSAANKFGQYLLPNGNTTGTTVLTGVLTYVTGDVMACAYDSANALIWFRKNNGSWAGNGASPDPATGTSGISVAPGNWPMMAFAGSDTQASIYTLRDRLNTQTGTIPSGYSMLSPAVAPVGSGTFFRGFP